MKKLITIILFCFITFIVISQEKEDQKFFKIKTLGVTSSEMLEHNVWSNWLEWTKTNVLITLDITANQIIIYGKIKNTFDIIEYQNNYTDDDGDEWIGFKTIDDNGMKVEIRHITMTENNGDVYKQICFDYKSYRILYYIDTQ